MLGKLLKHEMKALAHWFLPLYIGVGIALGLFGIMWTVKMVWNNEIFNTIFTASLIFLFVVILMVISLGTFFIVIMHFYKTMVSDEGYLTHTLPVSVDQLLISKGLGGFIWNIIAIIAMILVVGFFIFLTMVTTGMFHSDIWSTLVNTLDSVWTEFCNDLGMSPANMRSSVILWIAEYIVAILVSIISQLYLVYLSMALGQSVKGHKFLWSTIFYICIIIGTNMLTQIITTVAMLIYGVSTTSQALSAMSYLNFSMHGVMLLAILLSVAYSAAAYFLSRYMLKNRLNLE